MNLYVEGEMGREDFNMHSSSWEQQGAKNAIHC